MWFVVGVGYACFASFKVCFAAHYFAHNRMQLNVKAVCVGVLERERVCVCVFEGAVLDPVERLLIFEFNSQSNSPLSSMLLKIVF